MTTQSVESKSISAAQAMLREGDSSGALQCLSEARRSSPNHLGIVMNLAMVHRAKGDLNKALQTLEEALAIDPYSFLSLLSKGSILEQMNRPRLAADIYRNALKIAPPNKQTPESIKAPLEHARRVVEQQSREMAACLREAISHLLDSHDLSVRQRAVESIDLVAGITRVFHSEPIQFHYPRLPAIPFFDRDYFPWFGDLEASTELISIELMDLIESGLPGFSPYVAYAPGTPENQFADLNHSDDWRSFWFWRDGEPQPDAIEKCPKTAALLNELPMCDQEGFAPTALFSALAPHTRIPPHTGSTNTRLLVHLPLVLPGPAGFRVGNETRSWKLGEAWAFDDTIEHEAWNDSSQTRVIMIFDVWNPLLSHGERDIVRSLLKEQRKWLYEN